MFLARIFSVLALVTIACTTVVSQTPTGLSGMDGVSLTDAPVAVVDHGSLEPGADPQNRLLIPFLKHIASDQKYFWMTPAHLDEPSLKVFAGFTGFTGLLIGGDSWISRQVSARPSRLQSSQNISNYAVYSLIASGGGAFVLGKIKNDDHMVEAGLLSGEAALNSTAVAYLLKSVTQRPRPLEGNGNGTFFQGGNSFPSEHAAIAWSIASVMAHEYPGPFTKFFAYGLASAVTLTRVTGKQHFSSDVLVGSALGWYLGRQIYRTHHDPELGGAPWGNFIEPSDSKPVRTTFLGSPSVPLDSWVYAAFERLAALGYLDSAYVGLRPWTRLECARLLEEVADKIRYQGIEDREATRLYSALETEFRETSAAINGAPNLGVALESVYTGVTGISGHPLQDSFHFGQTIINNFGRPYGEGFNSYSGASAYAVAGPFAFYVRGEYQRAPGTPSGPTPVLQAIADADFTQPVSNAIPPANRFRLIEGTVSLKLSNLQISFGKQSEWLGPGQSGSLLMSNNAEPILMLRFESVSPFEIPGISRLLGRVRTEFMIGRLDGHIWDFNPPNLIGPGLKQQPFIHENKISFHPTANLELGVGVTAIFAGPGLPFTWSNFLKTFYSHKASVAAGNPAKRFSQFDLSYRIPGLRKWVTAYVDTLVGDEYSPIASTRPLLNPGIYLPQVPKFRNLQMRFEGINEPWEGKTSNEFPPGFVYYDLRYRSGYTNNGNLIGTWMGRAGLGGQAWATYSFAPRSKVEISYRHQEVNPRFLEGGRANDFSALGELMLGSQASLRAFLQYEQWKFPLLDPRGRSDLTVSVQLTFYPNLRLHK